MSRALARDERIPGDAYYTPDDVARACVGLIADEIRGAMVVEPSMGGGAFVRALAGVTDTIYGIDIDPNAPACEALAYWSICDFVTWRPNGLVGTVDAIVGNPPFTDAEAHVRHALDVVRPGGVVAFLLRLAFAEGRKRVPFWAEHPALSCHVLAERPSFTGGGTDSAAYAFWVWRHGYRGPTTIVPGWSWKGRTA